MTYGEYMQDFYAEHKRFRAYSQMYCHASGDHGAHVWESEHTIYGPYFCNGLKESEVKVQVPEWLKEQFKRVSRRNFLRTITPEQAWFEGWKSGYAGNEPEDNPYKESL